MNKYFVNPEEYIFEGVLVMKYTPKSLGTHIRSRHNSSFLYICKGHYRYTFAAERFDAYDGDTVYVPEGSEYTFAVLDPEAICIQIEFDLYRHSDGRTEPIRFFDRPTRIPTTNEAREIFTELAEAGGADTFTTLSLLYRLLSIFSRDGTVHSATDRERDKIRPAVDFINKTLSFRISTPELAERCGLSTPHFRRLFKSLMGHSPIKYKNQTLMKCACRMLESGILNVTEISSALGFPDIYTFSQTFKKEIGIPPSRYSVKPESKI